MSDILLASLTHEVDIHLAQADALKYGDPHSLLSHAQAAALHAQMLGDFHRYAQAVVHQAWAYGLLNQYELSLSHAMEVLMLARDCHMSDIEARAVGIIAVNFLKCGILQESAHLFEHQRLLGERLQDQMLQAMALNDLAVVRMELRDYNTAVSLLHEAVHCMPVDSHDGLDSIYTHLNLAFACVKTTRFIEAVEHAQFVLTRVKNSPKLISDAHLWIAAAHLGQGELEKAREEIAIARACVENASPPLYNDNVEQLTAELLVAEKRYQEAAQVWEYMYEMAIERQELDYAISALNHLKDVYASLNNTTGLVSAYKRLSEEIPARQTQSSNLRFAVLRMVFAMDKASLEAQLNLNHQKNEILRRLSHEFRTPLAIVQNATQTLEKYTDRLTLEQRQARLQHITTQVQWMTVMLDDILQVLRLDEDVSKLVQTAFQIEDLIESALRQIERYSVSQQRLRIHTHPSGVTIRSEYQSLTAVLVHLLTNALKFSEGEVKLDIQVSESTLIIQVVDQGIGIPLTEQQNVFQPLVRGSNIDQVTGNGLGLAIVARLVKQLGGSIDLVSVVDTGTTIAVRIPIQDCALPS